MNKEEVIATLKKADIEHDPKANKDVLVALLPKTEAKPKGETKVPTPPEEKKPEAKPPEPPEPEQASEPSDADRIAAKMKAGLTADQAAEVVANQKARDSK